MSSGCNSALLLIFCELTAGSRGLISFRLRPFGKAKWFGSFLQSTAFPSSHTLLRAGTQSTTSQLSPAQPLGGSIVLVKLVSPASQQGRARCLLSLWCCAPSWALPSFFTLFSLLILNSLVSHYLSLILSPLFNLLSFCVLIGERLFEAEEGFSSCLIAHHLGDYGSLSLSICKMKLLV